MDQEIKPGTCPSNRMTFFDRLKVAKKNREKTQKYMKENKISFIKELCGVTKQRPDLPSESKLLGYLHYDAGLSLFQIANDLGLQEDTLRVMQQQFLANLFH